MKTRGKMTLSPPDSAIGDEDEAAAERGEEGWGSALLRRGWWLGKRVAIAGAAITSAPVLIPPLLVFSTLGITLSFPFTLYLASFSGTKKVMGSLLPLPRPSIPSDGKEKNLVEEEVKDGGLIEELEVVEETETPDVYDGAKCTETAVEEAEAMEKTVATPDPFNKKVAEDVHPHVAAVPAESSIEIEQLGSEGERDETDVGKSEPSVALEDKGGIGPSSDFGGEHGNEAGAEVEREEPPAKEVGIEDRPEAEETGKEAEAMENTVTPHPLSKVMSEDIHPHVSVSAAESKIEIKNLGSQDKGEERDMEESESSVALEGKVRTRPSSVFGGEHGNGARSEVEGEETPAKQMGMEGTAEAEETGKEEAETMEKIVTPDPLSKEMAEDVCPHVVAGPADYSIEIEHWTPEDETGEKDVVELEIYVALEDKGGIGPRLDFGGEHGNRAGAEAVGEEAQAKEMGIDHKAETEETGKEETETMEKTVTPDPLSKEMMEDVHPHVAAAPAESRIEIEHLGSEDERGERDVVELSSVALDDKGGTGTRFDSAEEHENRAGAEAVGEGVPTRGIGIGGKGETEEMGKKTENGEQGIKIKHLDVEEDRDKGTMDKVKEEKLPTSGSPLHEIKIGLSSEVLEQDGNQGGIGTVEEDELMDRVATGAKAEAEDMSKKEQSILRTEHGFPTHDNMNVVILEREEEIIPEEGVNKETEAKEERKGEERKGEEGAKHRIETYETEQRGNRRVSESEIEQNRDERGSEMVQKERLVKEHKEVEDERKKERKGEEGSSDFSSEDILAAGDRSSDIADTESRGSMEQGLDTRLATPTSMEAAMCSDDEGLHLEEKIWEQVYAIRTIVGYKAALHSSLIGELRAIYHFTGVEPPASFKESADLAEVNDTLMFLKSVIGVK